MKLRTAVALLGLLAATFAAERPAAQTIQLKSGEVLIGVVLDPNEDGLQVQRLDNGGLLDLTWDQLSPDSASRIKTRWNLAVDEAGEVMIAAEEFEFELSSGGREKVAGRVIAENETTITVRSRGTDYPVQRSRIKHRAPVEVPVQDVYTTDEFYNEKLNEIAPGDDPDKHILLADVLTRVRDYEHAEEHLKKAAGLGGSRQANLLDEKLKRLALFKGARAEREHLDRIAVALARRDYQKGMALIDEFEQQYPSGKLRDEFERTKQRLLGSRERFLQQRVAELWHEGAATLADRKAAEAGLSFEAAKEYAETGMGKEIRARVQKKLGIEPDEVDALWAKRADDKRQPRPQRYSFGVGSWTLGEAAIRKDTPVDASEEPAEGGNEEMERMVERIRKATERAKRAAAAQGPGAGQDDTPEAWWEAATRDEKKLWLRAYYAEFGGDMVVASAHLDPCVTCGSAGRLTVFGQSGKVEKPECPTCHNTKFKRYIRAY